MINDLRKLSIDLNYYFFYKQKKNIAQQCHFIGTLFLLLK